MFENLCRICYIDFDSSDELVEHQLTEHNIQPIKIEPAKEAPQATFFCQPFVLVKSEPTSPKETEPKSQSSNETSNQNQNEIKPSSSAELANDNNLKPNCDKPRNSNRRPRPNQYCSLCKITLSTAASYRRHCRSFHPDLVTQSITIIPDQPITDHTNQSIPPHSINGRKRTVECPVCSRVFFSQADLSCHNRVHTGEQPFSCRHCGKKFSQKVNCKRHEKSKFCTGNKESPAVSRTVVSWTQIASKRTQKSYERFQRNKQNTNKPKASATVFVNRDKSKRSKYQCPICSRMSQTASKLAHHMNLHYGRKPFQCSNCDSRFSSPSARSLHLTRRYCFKTNETLTADSKFESANPVVSTPSFLPPIALSEQLTALYGISTSETTATSATPKKPKIETSNVTGESKSSKQKAVEDCGFRQNGMFHCNKCEKIFKQKISLIDHQNYHTGLRPYECDKCSKTYIYQSQFSRHLNLCNPQQRKPKPQPPILVCGFEKDGRFHCYKCEKSFTSKINLLDHQNKHNGQKPYKCEQCGKQFGAAPKYSIHKKSCAGKTATKHDSLNLPAAHVAPLKKVRQRQRTHLDGGFKLHGRFHCYKCEKTFTTRTNLVQHQNLHNGLKPYECNKCGSSYIYEASLKTHEKKCKRQSIVTDSMKNSEQSEEESSSTAPTNDIPKENIEPERVVMTEIPENETLRKCLKCASSPEFPNQKALDFHDLFFHKKQVGKTRLEFE